MRARGLGLSIAFALNLLLVFAFADIAAADDQDPVGVQAQEILKSRCYNCHGVNFNGSSKLNVTDRDALLKEGYLDLENPEESAIVERITAGEMPPEDSGIKALDEDETKTLLAWIRSGAPVANKQVRKYQGNIELVEKIHNHLLETDTEDRPYSRYFSLGHLSNNNQHVSDLELRLYRAALSKVLNSLSYEPLIVVPQAIDDEQTVFHIDIRDYGWTKDQWTSLMQDYPYGIHFQNCDDRKLARLDEQAAMLSSSRLYWIRADWFINAASRTPIYDRFLDLPDNISKVEQRLNVNFERNFQQDRLVRAGFASSAVSKGNRMVERHPSAFGYYWKSYDFKNGGLKGNLFRFPLGPVFDGNNYSDLAFAHDGGEMIFSLPNGLQAYYLTDAEGEQLTKGPIEVVRDSLETAGTPEVTNALSCMHCHRHGMLPIQDTVRQGVGVFGEAKRKVQQLYPEDKDMQKYVAADKAQFMRALEKAIGPFVQVEEEADRDIEQFPEPVGAIARFYQRDLDIHTVASELGISDVEELRKTIQSNDQLKQIGIGVLGESGKIKRSDWESREAFISPMQETMRILKLGTPLN